MSISYRNMSLENLNDFVLTTSKVLFPNQKDFEITDTKELSNDLIDDKFFNVRSITIKSTMFCSEINIQEYIRKWFFSSITVYPTVYLYNEKLRHPYVEAFTTFAIFILENDENLKISFKDNSIRFQFAHKI